MFSAAAFGFDAACSWFRAAANTYRAAGCAQQRAETCVVNLLLVPVCDTGILCFSPTPAGMGQMTDKREGLGCPLAAGTPSLP